jgi:hypothetical protein
MTQQERAETFKAFKEAEEDAKKEVGKIAEEAQEIISNLYDKKRKGEVKINVADTFYIDSYHEHVLHSKYSVEKRPLFIGDMEEDGTEEEFGFVFQRLNDLKERAKSNFEKIKHLVSKYD